MKKFAFTLAEVMIVLTVIGVLTAILLPVARQNMPDEDLMRFKKAHNTLGTVIRELVTSDKYYIDGDLSVKADNSDVNSTYLCETMTEVLNVKEKNCTEYSEYDGSYVDWNWEFDKYAHLDNSCLASLLSVTSPQFLTSDNVAWWEVSSFAHFATYHKTATDKRLFKDVLDSNNFVRVYKIFCIDVDGIPAGATNTNCVNECPFGYAIRYDGKIIAGARAQEWLEREE